ncbi:MAG: ABC transporter ATP-binding protein [Chloroflexi bacterium]|nr:MAG: ABC transporter ATP-binding protein [Chloroflexota bacterium]MBL1197092.1 ABC transporter ATP-binding protein [Chloroflexota bacterium]NOH14387.1 ABC transporter ATP-binding protein [Chloroflexota bacterium]
MTEPLLQVENLTMHYTTRAGELSAVDNVSFSLKKGEALGLVGESGCGKTSVALTVLKLLPENGYIKEGKIIVNGKDIVPYTEQEMRKVRWGEISMVFQAAMNALNPVYRVGDQIIEALEEHQPQMTNKEMKQKVTELFELVGLESALMDRFPHEFSGGMRQRAVIAMALSCGPDMIIADEPTTALDVIVQDSLLKEMREFQDQLGMAMIYISHDVGVIAEVSDRVGVMYAGRLAEMGTAEEIFHDPIHPYTMALMSSFPSTVGEKTDLVLLPGEPPDLLNPPTGCRFHPRCPYATDVCKEEQPEFKEHSPGHLAACWHPRGEQS